VVDIAEVGDLLTKYPDAFALLLILRRHHSGARQTFAVANAMAATMPGGGWPTKRFAAARRCLEELGVLEQVRPASRASGAAIYRFKGRQS
jgi:hypothetical protein